MPSRLRVPLGWVVAAVVLAFARPTLVSVAGGATLLALGEAIRLWASGHIEKTHRLAMGGPYAHTRNPLYVGSVIMGAGVALATASVWAAIAIAGYLLAFYPWVMREESRFLAAKFPDEYSAWSRDVPAFVPRFRARGPRTSRFSWARVSANREWRTAAVLPFALALLYVRGWLEGR